MDLRLKRTPGLYLVGFMGSGKTTIGRLLADRIGWHFADLDDDIEARERVSITDIFALRGEAEFRRIETEAVRERVRAVAAGAPTVLALGGGAFVQPASYELISSHGVSIWLDCPLELAWSRASAATHRPLARDRAGFAALFEARRAAYSKADFRVAVESDDAEANVGAVLRLPIFR